MRAHRKTRRRFSALVLRPRPRSVISVVTSTVSWSSGLHRASRRPCLNPRGGARQANSSSPARLEGHPPHTIATGALRSIGPFNWQASGLMAGFGAPALFRGGGLGVLACDCDASRRRLQARKASSHPRPRCASSGGGSIARLMAPSCARGHRRLTAVLGVRSALRAVVRRLRRREPVLLHLGNGGHARIHIGSNPLDAYHEHRQHPIAKLTRSTWEAQSAGKVIDGPLPTSIRKFDYSPQLEQRPTKSSGGSQRRYAVARNSPRPRWRRWRPCRLAGATP